MIYIFVFQELIDPLLDVAWSSRNSKDYRTLGERAQALFQNKLCPSKEVNLTSVFKVCLIYKYIIRLFLFFKRKTKNQIKDAFVCMTCFDRPPLFDIQFAETLMIHTIILLHC